MKIVIRDGLGKLVVKCNKNTTYMASNIFGNEAVERAMSHGHTVVVKCVQQGTFRHYEPMVKLFVKVCRTKREKLFSWFEKYTPMSKSAHRMSSWNERLGRNKLLNEALDVLGFKKRHHRQPEIIKLHTRARGGESAFSKYAKEDVVKNQEVPTIRIPDFDKPTEF